MRVYLVRHSFAENTHPDSKRELSSEGKRVLVNSINIWKKLEINFDSIYSSPLVRAIQTAEIINMNFNSRASVVKEEILLPGSSSSDLINLINSIKFENIIIIGHQPDLSHHLSNLISSSLVNCCFAPATLAEISFPGRARLGNGILEKLIPPIQ